MVPAPSRVRAKSVIRKLRQAFFPQPYLWQTIAEPTLSGITGQYPTARTELLDLVSGTPRRLVDLGCGNGMTASAAKSRFPEAEVVGIEQNPASAKLAAERLDRVIITSIEQLDYDSHGLAEGSIDVAFLLDVLEHLYDPWDALCRLRSRLAPAGQIIASIPNARNYWLLSRLVNDGNFSYDSNGLLDITHIRFFTRHEIEKMFAETGYKIVQMVSNYDDRVPEVLPLQSENDRTDKFVLQNLTANDVKEFRTLQFYVVATPMT
jgi:trans-aconitate methyltransferase